MNPQLTNKDMVILNFISEFSICKYMHLESFVGITEKNLYRLEANKRIEVEGKLKHLCESGKKIYQLDNLEKEEIKNEEIRIKNMQVESQVKKNMLEVLNVLTKLYKDSFIDDIKGMDLPYYATARVMQNGEYMFFTIINQGSEPVQCKLLDRENYGNVVMILESKTQASIIKKYLTTKVASILYLEDYK